MKNNLILLFISTVAVSSLHAQTMDGGNGWTQPVQSYRNESGVSAVVIPPASEASSEDRQKAAKVTQSINSDKSISPGIAHNIKVTIVNGIAYLRGTVVSNRQRNEVVSKTSSVVGKDHVRSQIHVQGESTGTLP